MSKVDFLPHPLRRVLFGLPARVLPKGFKGQWTFHNASLDSVERYAKLVSASSRADKTGLLSKSFLKRFDGYDDYWHFRKYWREDLDPLSRMQYLDMKTYLNDDVLTKMDRASMSVSLEARVPLLDHELIEAVTNLPREVRNKNWVKKHILKVAMADYLPQPLLTRKKQGFSVPFHAWLKDPKLKTIGPVYDAVFNADSLSNHNVINAGNFWRLKVMNNWLTANG